MSTTPDDSELNAGHFHEVMDRASVVSTMFDTVISNIDAVKMTPELAEAAEEASDALGKFYQIAAVYYWENWDSKEKK